MKWTVSKIKACKQMLDVSEKGRYDNIKQLQRRGYSTVVYSHSLFDVKMLCWQITLDVFNREEMGLKPGFEIAEQSRDLFRILTIF